MVRVFDDAKAIKDCRSSSMPNIFQISAVRHLQRAIAHCRQAILNAPTKRAPLQWRKVGPVDLFRKLSLKMTVATYSNSSTAPLMSLLLTMNMAGTIFTMTVDECIAGVIYEAARALGLLPKTVTTRSWRMA